MVALRSCAPRMLTAFCLGFVLSFNEFDIAAILGTSAWSVTVFDAHAGGLPGVDSLKLALIALAAQAPAIIGGLISLRLALIHRPIGIHEQPKSTIVRTTSWIFLLLTFGVIVFVPLAIVFEEAIGGLGQAVSQFALKAEIFASVYLGIAATVLSYLAARWLSRRPGLSLVAVLPCLSGSLLIGLAVLGFVQGVVPVVRSGPIPAVIALGLGVLPAAVVLCLLLNALGKRSGSLEARRSGDAGLRWRYGTAPVLGACAFVFLLAYFEVVVPSILAPPGMTTAFERLHNLMHYGRTTALSAMVVIAFIVPLILVASLWLFRFRVYLSSGKSRNTLRMGAGDMKQ